MHLKKENNVFVSVTHAYLCRHTKKGPCGFPACGSLNAHAKSPIRATDIRFFFLFFFFFLKLP